MPRQFTAVCAAQRLKLRSRSGVGRGGETWRRIGEGRTQTIAAFSRCSSSASEWFSGMGTMAISKSKSAPSRPYRRSIWRHDPRYDVDHSVLSASEVATICRLSSVDAAKKQVPPVPPKGLLAIAKAARALPAVGAGSPAGRFRESAGLDGWFEITIHLSVQGCFYGWQRKSWVQLVRGARFRVLPEALPPAVLSGDLQA